MATRKPRSGGGSRSKAGRSSPFPSPKVSRSIEGEEKRTVYKVSVPKNLRDDPKAIAKFLNETVARQHGKGGKAYRDQHFMMTFSGTMYNEDDADSEKMGRATFGTYANRNLSTVASDLQSRLQRLKEGETPRTLGDPGKYGFFAAGVTEVTAIVMERQPKKRKRKK